MTPKPIVLEKIDIYGGTQTRVATNDEAIVSYAEAMSEGAQFPPVVVFFDGTQYWLADGFHRYLATKQIGKKEIEADVREGGRTDALIFALGANSTNGLFRSNDDKRNATEIALDEWWDKSNSYIADICKVSNDLVSKMRRRSGKQMPDKVTGKDGKQYPTQIERQPRGETESSSGGRGGAGGGTPSKKNANYVDAPGGASREIEADARKMIRDGEIDPRELDNLGSAEATDYAHAAVHLLERMNPEDKQYDKALLVLQKWVDKKLGATYA